MESVAIWPGAPTANRYPCHVVKQSLSLLYQSLGTAAHLFSSRHSPPSASLIPLTYLYGVNHCEAHYKIHSRIYVTIRSHFHNIRIPKASVGILKVALFYISISRVPFQPTIQRRALYSNVSSQISHVATTPVSGNPPQLSDSWKSPSW